MVPVRRPGRPLTSCPHLPNSGCDCPDSPKPTASGPRIDWNTEASISTLPSSSWPTSGTVSHGPSEIQIPSNAGVTSAGTQDNQRSSSPSEAFSTLSNSWGNLPPRNSLLPPSPPGHPDDTLPSHSLNQTPWATSADPTQPFSNRLSGSSSYEVWMPSRSRQSTQISEFGAVDEDMFGDIDMPSLPNETSQFGARWNQSFDGQTSFFTLPAHDTEPDSSQYEWHAE